DVSARSHLVHVYDVGIAPDAKGRAFLVMEFVEGTTLAAQFTAYRDAAKATGFKGVPGPVMLKWARQLIHAMAALHSLKPAVIHRDLKPDNVLLGGPDRHVRVVDFGLASKLMSTGCV